MEQFRPVGVVAEDAALATALQAGDEDALRTLVARFGGPVFAVARRFGGERDTATRATLDVFLEAWRTIDDVERGADLASWLAAISGRWFAPDPPSEHETGLVWSVSTAVDTLDRDVREAVRLRDADRCTVADIATRLDVTGEVVEERLAGADRRLGNRLEPVRGAVGGAAVDAVLANAATWEKPPADLADRVVAAVVAEAGVVDAADVAPARRRPTWIRPALLGALAAIVGLFGAVVVLSALSATDDRETLTVALTPTGSVVDAAGDIELTVLDAGIGIELTATSLPTLDDGAVYQAWVATSDGGLVPVGTFRTGGAITLFAGVDLARIESFLITREAVVGGGDAAQASSGDVVLRATIGG